MGTYALLKGHITKIVPMSLVNKYKRRGLIPKASVRNSRTKKIIDSRDLETVYVQDEDDHFRIMGGDLDYPE